MNSYIPLLLICIAIGCVSWQLQAGWQLGGSTIIPSPYHNSCMMAAKSYGYPASQGADKYWKNRVNDWGSEYDDAHVNQKVNDVKSSVSANTTGTGNTEAHSISLDYYHNPVAYRKKHPDQYPCPNYWLEAGAPDTFVSDNMVVPKLETTRPHIAKNIVAGTGLAIDDSNHTRIVNPGRQDQGLCQPDRKLWNQCSVIQDQQ